jgi:hypothetical protein
MGSRYRSAGIADRGLLAAEGLHKGSPGSKGRANAENGLYQANHPRQSTEQINRESTSTTCHTAVRCGHGNRL